MSSSSHHVNSAKAKVQTALVTGSSRSNGIGYAAAQCLAKNHSMNIILHGTRDVTTPEVELCRSTIGKEHGVSVYYIQADLSKTTGAQRLCDEVDKIYPDGIDVLVNNAGHGVGKYLEDITPGDWQCIQTLNLTTPFMLIKHFIPAMKKNGWGRIINISSVLGVRGFPGRATYCSSKHGLNGLSKVVGLEAADTGVTCNAICPAFVETDLYIKATQYYANRHGLTMDEAKGFCTNATKKLITPQQIGETTSFLCSPAADNITASDFVIDGGSSA